jgi:putative transposase
VADNTLDRQFDVQAPDRVWGTDITYIQTQDGFAYLAVSMQRLHTTDVVLQVRLMAV